MRRNIIVTGATGFLGSWLAHSLLSDPETNQVYAVIRGSSQSDAEKRLQISLRKTRLVLTAKLLKKIIVLRGDIEKRNLGLSESTIIRLSKKQITDVFHSAAIADFNTKYSDLYKSNISGVRNVIRVIEKIKARSDNYPTLHHISTVAIAGDYSGSFTETMFSEGQNFNNAYEKSKYYAEIEARKLKLKGGAVKIYRPAIIMGDSRTGVTTNFKMAYQPLHLISNNLLDSWPASSNSVYSFVPVDITASAINILSKLRPSENDTFHVVNPNYISLGMFVKYSSDFLDVQPPKLIAPNKYKCNFSYAKKALVGPYVPYFNYRAIFNSKYTNGLLKHSNIIWPKINKSYIGKIIRYCEDVEFIRRKK